MTTFRGVVFLAVCAMCASSGLATVRQVGPGRTYTTVQAASNACVDGDVIEIDSGNYLGSACCAYFYDNTLTIRGVGATRPKLYANGTSAESKGIFVLHGNNCVVENLEFYDCAVTDRNGAGIRLDGRAVTVRSCYFQNNQMGILTGNWGDDNDLIEYCEFNNNGYTGADHVGHSIYIGVSNQLTIRYCWSHDTKSGHNLKTRAKTNYILYNRLTTQNGTTSYEVDIPIGGTSYVIGNLIHQGINASNATVISYAGEGMTNPDQHLYVVNNTFVNNRPVGTFVYNASTTSALVQNNILQGPGTVLSGPGTQTTNWPTTNAYLQDSANYDYRLTASSVTAINGGTAPGTGINGFNMTPVSQYVQNCGYEPRPGNGTIDIGCYEYARVLQTGLNSYAGTRDNYVLAGSPTTNYGTSTKMTVTGYADQGLTNRVRPLVRFDLSSITPGTTITHATLYVFSYDPAAVRGSTGYYGLYYLTRDWNETQSTWNKATSSVNWTTPGGDFNASADAQAAKQSTAGVWYAFDVTSRVQGWINNGSTNYGWVLKCTDENVHNQDAFYSSAASDTWRRPKLVVCTY